MTTSATTRPDGDLVPADVVIDDALVTRLLADQHPDLLARRRRVMGAGWDHVMVVLGEEEELVLRLPRRMLGGQMIPHEQRFLAEVGADLPLPVPVPVRIGESTSYYPYRWSVVPWFDGTVAAAEPATDHEVVARQLGDLLAAVHRPAPEYAPHNHHRGPPLSSRIQPFAERLARLPDGYDRPGLRRIMDRAVDAPAWGAPPTWVHGDLHPGNVLIEDGRVSAVLDWSDVHSGDPAVDAIIAWMMLPREHHATFRHRLPTMDDHTWVRGMGWAVHLGMTLVLHTLDGGNPWYARVGRRALTALSAEA